MDEREDAKRSRIRADQRDRQADADDYAADKRDMAANLDAWLHDEDKAGAAHGQREAAGRDRANARADRNAAASTRSELAED
jgi:hypothetical protein